MKFIAAIGALCAFLALSAAQAAPRAEFVIDARNGEVLHSRNANTALHPASLTKMMTLYLVFEAVRDGKLGLDQRVPVSRRAAAQPPSKIGFRAGQKVRVRELIRAAAIRSANDSAVVLAEAVAGSESRFAALMTRRARQLGMTNTTFRNASGLTARGHLSTAHDMAIMGRRLFFDFPQYYNLFGRVTTPAFGRTIRNTNRLLSSYRGADGIKTGYTRAAGFNLCASAERNGERVIAVMFGGSSSRARNARVAELLNLGFRKAPRHVRVVPPGPIRVAARPLPVPPPRPALPGAPSLVVASTEAAPVAHPGAIAARANAAPQPAAGAVALSAYAPPPRDPDAATSFDASGDWAVQLGDYAQRDVAVARLASAAFGAMPELAAAGREVEVSSLGESSIYRARLTGLSPLAAHEACKRLRAEGANCRAVPPN